MAFALLCFACLTPSFDVQLLHCSDLESNGLTGSLPNDAWSSLPQLARLMLGNNAGLGGTLPAGIGTLSSLELL